MNLSERKIAFVTEFFKLEDESIISSLEDILKKKRIRKYEENLKEMRLDEFYKDIDASLEDSTNDRVTKAKELKSKYA